MGKILSFFIKKRSEPTPELPWKGLPAIYPHIKKRLLPDGKLSEAGQTLPDDERRYKPGDIRWVAGGMDGVLSHHGGGDGDKNTAKKIASLTNDIARKESLQKKVGLYQLLTQDTLMDYIDPALEALIELRPPIFPHLHALARWFVRESPDRGPVKFGLALLGLIQDTNDLRDIILVGKHEEFTLFSAVAVMSILDDPESILWEMAKAVDGWGRIQLIERLSETTNPAIKDWLLREGYKNSVMYEYLAYTCAITGELHHVLSAPVIDTEMLDSAGELIEALINGGPAENIDDYEYAAEVIQAYLKHLEPNAHKLEHFIVADTLDSFLSADEEEWAHRTGNGWPQIDRSELATIAQRIKEKPIWRDLVLSNLETPDESFFWIVKRAAQSLHIDLWQTCWQRLQASPLESVKWFDVMERVDCEHIEEVLRFAQTHLPLETIATGQAKEMGLGKAYNAHSCLDVILQMLGRFPGYGAVLIQTGLESPVIRNRNMAIRALSAWKKEQWTEGMKAFLETTLPNEPDEHVKASIKNLLSGESL